MMEATLHGRDAADALRVYARLGKLDARFDGRRVAGAVLTAKGRMRLLAVTSTRMLRGRIVRMLVPRSRSRARRDRRTRRSPSGRSRARSGHDGPGRPDTRLTLSTPESGAEDAIRRCSGGHRG